MLKGKEFGEAIGRAIDLKLSTNGARTKAEIARHFKIKPPSLSDWVKKGAVAKEKLPELWRYFSDVAGPEHWGMTKAEWPAGLTPSHENSLGTQERAQNPIESLDAWPFKNISRDRYDSLTVKQREAIEEWIDDQINKYTGQESLDKSDEIRRAG